MCRRRVRLQQRHAAQRDMPCAVVLSLWRRQELWWCCAAVCALGRLALGAAACAALAAAHSC